jgi:hypothetical protein
VTAAGGGEIEAPFDLLHDANEADGALVVECRFLRARGQET